MLGVGYTSRRRDVVYVPENCTWSKISVGEMMADQRQGPTRSPRSGKDRAQMRIGAKNMIVPVSVSGR